jgi:hypothetical protein
MLNHVDFLLKLIICTHEHASLKSTYGFVADEDRSAARDVDVSWDSKNDEAGRDIGEDWDDDSEAFVEHQVWR